MSILKEKFVAYREGMGALGLDLEDENDELIDNESMLEKLNLSPKTNVQKVDELQVFEKTER
jgi:hypothetical protein